MSSNRGICQLGVGGLIHNQSPTLGASQLVDYDGYISWLRTVASEKVSSAANITVW